MILDRYTGISALLLIALASIPSEINAFHIPSNRLSNRRSLLANNYDHRASSIVAEYGQASRHQQRSVLLYMVGEDEEEAEYDEDYDEETPDATSTDSESTDDDDEDSDEEDPTKTISAYKSGLNARRATFKARPGSSQTSIDVTMKFGGSSLANSDRVDHVANLIKDRIRPPANEDGSASEEMPVRPRAGKFCVQMIIFCANYYQLC